MRRRLDIAMSLVGDAPIIFFDEPSTGLDPQSRSDMWLTIRQLVEHGTTVFLTTQYLEEADHLADEVAILHGGRIVASGTPNELKRRVGTGHLVLGTLAYPTALADRPPRVLPGAIADTDALTLRVDGARMPTASGTPLSASTTPRRPSATCASSPPTSTTSSSPSRVPGPRRTPNEHPPPRLHAHGWSATR